MFSIKDFIDNDPKIIIDHKYKYDQYNNERAYYESKKIVELTQFDKDLVAKMNEKELTDLVNQKFYNGEIMDLFSRYTNLLVHLSGQEDSIQDFFTNPKRIGTDSIHGVAFKANLKNLSDMFVLKVPREEDLIHEFFVGSHLNNLRGQVLNFSYVYGAFDCNFPELIEKNIYNICSSKVNMVNYLIQENIKNNISFKDFSATSSFKNFILVYIQVLLALAYANDIYQYTHYDLHYENVLVVESEYEVVIPYPYKGNTIYIKTKYIPFIIDYGFSHININGIDYSYNGKAKLGKINLYISNPLNDYFKLLAALATSSKPENYNKGIYYLLKFFINDISEDRNTAMEQLNEIYKKSYSYLPGDNFPNHYTFIEYLLEKMFNIYPEISYSYDSITPLLGCSATNICETKETVVQKITNVNNPINIVYEIYQDVKKRPFDIWDRKNRDFKDEDKFYNNQHQFINFVKKNIEEYKQKRSIFVMNDYTKLPSIEYFTDDVIDTFDTQIKSYYYLYDLINKIVYELNIITYLMAFYDRGIYAYTPEYSSLLENMKKERKSFIFDNEVFVLSNIRYFREMMKKQKDNITTKQIKLFNSLSLFTKQ